jgi:hypothetical protein
MRHWAFTWEFTYKISTCNIPTLKPVISNKKQLLASKLGVSESCSYIDGDMFTNGEIPFADAYIMK